MLARKGPFAAEPTQIGEKHKLGTVVICPVIIFVNKNAKNDDVTEASMKPWEGKGPLLLLTFKSINLCASSSVKLQSDYRLLFYVNSTVKSIPDFGLRRTF